MQKPEPEQQAAPDGPVYGEQRPRLLTVPGIALSSAGQEAVDLAERAGLHLDAWQRFVLDQGMGERADGNWAASEVCVNVPRQNGKGAVIEARVLWGLFIGGEKQILLSAHEFKTTHNTMKRIERLIEGCSDLRKRVKQFHKTVGREGIELHDGRELKYIARSRGSGRGFTADCVIFDECMILGDDAMSALAPTSDAVENSQLWYLGSAGIGHLSQQMARLRKRCVTSLEKGVPDPVLAYMEWSINQHRDECMPGCTEHDDIDSVQSLLRANPGVGYRLQVEKSMQRRLTMGDHLYARERLGVGEYPSDEADTWQVIGEDAWRSLAAAESAPEGEVVFAIDATPEQDHAAIAVAGRWRGGTHIEIAHHQPGMGWVVAKAKRMQEEHKPRCWVVDAGGPAGSLIQELEEELGIKVVSPKMREVAQAAGQFFTAVADQSISHIDQPLLATALAGAQKRPLGDAWAWARRGGGVDISPLVAATHAKWGLGVEVEDDVDPLDNIF
ncbi:MULTISPECIES: terminase [Streptomyces]|uniref:terminase n=1 Tax=Streptomyces TaxID=1883 RepID=UPI00067DB4AE|nr:MULTISPECIES: terminase [Streptomyces]KOG81243.1 terminase [Streptomyces griseus subsp. rhodochrous]